MSTPKPLTPKEERFVAEYDLDGNATRAHKAAGYKAKSDAAHGVAAHKLLKKPDIAAAVERRRQSRLAKIEITAERVLLEIARLAFSDMRDVAAWTSGGVTLLDSKDISDHAAKAIAEIHEHTNSRGETTVKVKLHDKKPALHMLAEHLQLLVQRVSLEGGEKPVRVEGGLTNEMINDIRTKILGLAPRVLRPTTEGDPDAKPE